MKGPVVQAPAKSSISCGTRVGYSELYPFRSWKAPKMETAQLLLSGRLPTLELENKQPKQGISALIRGVLPLISLERTLHPPSCWLLKPIQAGSGWPHWDHPHAWGSSSKLQPGNTNISWHWWKDHRKAAGFITRMAVPTSQPALLIQNDVGTTYLGSLCDFIKYFEQSRPALGGLKRVNQWAFLIITKCLLVCLSLLWNPVKYFLIRKDFLGFSNCSQREATFSDPVLGNDHLKISFALFCAILFSPRNLISHYLVAVSQYSVFCNIRHLDF